MDALQKAIAAASRGAAPVTVAAPAAAPNPVVVAAPAPAVVATAPAPAAGRRTLEEVAAAQRNRFQNFLKVSDAGLSINDGKDRHVTIDVEMVLSQVDFGMAVNWEPTPSTYVYGFTPDGITDTRRRCPWADSVATAESFGRKPYETSNIPMTLLADVVHKKPDPGKTYAAGTLIGLSTNQSNDIEFKAFLGEALQRYGRDDKIKVRLGFEERMYNRKTVIITYTLIEG